MRGSLLMDTRRRITQERVPPELPESEMMALAEATGWQSMAFPAAGALVAYLILILANPARHFFRDGLRCVQRHPRMWIWLSVLGLVYTLFQNLQAYQLGEAQFSLANLLRWPGFKPHDWRDAAGHAWLPALEL